MQWADTEDDRAAGALLQEDLGVCLLVLALRKDWNDILERRQREAGSHIRN